MKKPIVEAQNLARSCHETLILSALRDGPRHGYQLALDLEARSGGQFRFNHGTLYPILHRLEKDGLIAGVWTDDGGSRRRKQYEVTAKGRVYAGEQLAAWRAFVAGFLGVVEGGQT